MMVNVRLDLTKRRLDTLMAAREEIVESISIRYVYADINCRLKAKLCNGKMSLFLIPCLILKKKVSDASGSDEIVSPVNNEVDSPSHQ